MYQSVFVIAEEKNECIIATEVSFVCFFTVFLLSQKAYFVFLSVTNPFFFFIFFLPRYNQLKILDWISSGVFTSVERLGLFNCKLLLLKT